MLEHGVHGDERFAHASDQGHPFRFTGRQQPLVEVANDRIVTAGYHRCHIQGGSYPGAPALTGVCMEFYGGATRVTSRLDLGSGQGSGSSQTRLQKRPKCSKRLSQAMPWRITLTIRPVCCGLLR